jgi:two-component system, NarL family, sensor histidine kinase DesK
MMHSENIISKYFNFGDLIVIFTWATVFGISVSLMPSASESVQQNQPYIFSLFIVYLVCFLLATRESDIGIVPQWLRWTSVIIQLVSAFTLLFLLPLDFLPILTVIWAAVIAHYLKMSHAIIATIMVVIVWFSLYAHLYDRNPIYMALLYASFHGFALMSHIQIVRVNQAKEELQLKHQELLATQHLLSEASKSNERMRIARDLHDVIGHHLTALTINLQVAGHLCEGEAKKKVDQSHSIAKLLLSDVREAVSDNRKSKHLSFAPALELLTKNIPNLTTHISVAEDVNIDQIDIAEAVLRVIQESLTNSMKHSGATDYYLDMRATDIPSVIINIKDNGRIKPNLAIGNGLSGMLERINLIGGAIEFETETGYLNIHIDIPLQKV